MRAWQPLILLALTPCLLSQRGDRAGEAQLRMPDDVEVPPAVVRSPAAEQQSFRLADGVHVELFAAEPLVRDPVAMAFDAVGRAWVVEMRSYMRDVDATDEGRADGRIVVLHDDDGDLRADRQTVFADELVLPRAVLPCGDGALVITPPELLWLHDDDGDLRADRRERIVGGFDAGLANPEHCGNGLVWGLDHRVHLAGDKRVLVPTRTGFTVAAGAGGGQWGWCHDDRGRCYFNYNEDWLRCDLVPGRHGPAAQRFGGLPGLNHRVVDDVSVWPVRRTPGVNRGYREGVLRDWTLARHTAVCAPQVWRHGASPFDGDVFVCEPAGNVVRRFVLRDHDGDLRGDNPLQAERREFLASLDERFRPVHLQNGPDGALYVVDMYRGVIQHRNFVTSYLRDQIERRQLADPVGLGRIWRLVPDGMSATAAPQLASGADLVGALGHDSGCVRDLALAEMRRRRPAGVGAAVRALTRAPRPAVRIAALAALDGLALLDANDLRGALLDGDRGVVAFALQHAGPALARGDRLIASWIDALAADTAPTVLWHAALALGDALQGEVGMPPPWRTRLIRSLARLVPLAPGDRHLRAAVAVAAGPALAEVLQELAVQPGAVAPDCQAALRDLVRRAVGTRDAVLQQAVFAVAAAMVAEDRMVVGGALLQGGVDALPKGSKRDGWLQLGDALVRLQRLGAHADARVHAPARQLLLAAAVEAAETATTVAPLVPAERARVNAGERVFLRVCAVCHQADGGGQAGLAPPLRDSEWVSGPAHRPIRIVLHGVRGPLEVGGSQWSLDMPGHGTLSDAEVAEVLSFVRHTFGDGASCVTPAEVEAQRERHRQRSEAWTADELLRDL